MPSRDPGVARILDKIAAGLSTLVETGASEVIDLRQETQLAPDAYDELRSTLGDGEVVAEVRRDGAVEVVARETAFAGLWCSVARRPGALPVPSTSMIALPDFCRTLPLGAPLATTRT